MEMLLALAIIGILSTVVFANVGRSRIRAQDTLRKSDIKQLGQATEVYFQEYFAFPTTLNDLKNHTPAYFVTFPVDPRTKTDYHYRFDSTTKKFCIGGKMEQMTTLPDSANCDSGDSSDNYKITGP